MKKIILIILIIAILGALGFLVFNKKGSLNNLKNDSNDKKEQVSNEPMNFTHPDLGFNFFYPAQYKLTRVNEAEGESILIQKNGFGMQIFITDFTGKIFNSALVKKDITDVKLENVADIDLPVGISAVSFSYKDQSIGEVWNVWFVKDKKIYQVTSQKGHDEVLKMFVQTLKFE